MYAKFGKLGEATASDLLIRLENMCCANHRGVSHRLINPAWSYPHVECAARWDKCYAYSSGAGRVGKGRPCGYMRRFAKVRGWIFTVLYRTVRHGSARIDNTVSYDHV